MRTISTAPSLRCRVVVTAVVVSALVAGCGDGPSAQERSCDAGASLRSSIGSLLDLDELIAGGTDGLNDAVEQIGDDLDELRDAASDAAADEVDALGRAVEDLESAIGELGGELTRDNATAVVAAIGDVGAAAQGVFDTLSDCE